MALPGQTFTTIAQLIAYINQFIVPNANMAIIGTEHNNVENGLASFIVSYTLNSSLVHIVTTGGVVVLPSPIVVITGAVPTSVSWGDDVQNEYYVINATASEVPIAGGFSYVDQFGIAQTSFPSHQAVHMAKATNGQWIMVNNLTGGSPLNADPQTLLGRYANTAGPLQEITIGSGLALDPVTGVLTGSGTLTVTSQKLLGRYAATTGPVQEITIGTGLTLDETTGELSVSLEFNADNGLSVDAGGFLVLGQDVGEMGAPATLLDDREIPMDDFALNFIGDNGTLGINGTNLLDITQSLTGSTSPSAINLGITWNTSAAVDLIHINVAAAQIGAGSKIINFIQDGVARFIIDESAGLLRLFNTGIQVLGFETAGGISLNGASPSNNTINFGLGLSFTPSGTNDPGAAIVFGGNVGTTLDTGNLDLLQTIFSFQPLSGNATYNELHFNSSINQTGGASGITRTIFIEPALTSAADYRAIEVSVGKSIFNGPVSINTSAVPTAGLFLGAGTATAGTASQKFQAGGVVLTAPENGALEFDDTNLYITSGSTRQTILSELAVSASVLNTVTNKVRVSIAGVTYYLLASTSAS